MSRKQIPTKKKKSGQPAKIVVQRHVEQELEKFRELAEARGRIAKAAWSAQDARTKAAINLVRDRLLLGATGLISVRVKGQSYSAEVEVGLLEHNALFVACEIFKDLALMDIRVESYEFPDAYCAICNAELTKTKIPKRKKRP